MKVDRQDVRLRMDNYGWTTGRYDGETKSLQFYREESRHRQNIVIFLDSLWMAVTITIPSYKRYGDKSRKIFRLYTPTNIYQFEKVLMSLNRVDVWVKE